MPQCRTRYCSNPEDCDLCKRCNEHCHCDSDDVAWGEDDF